MLHSPTFKKIRIYDTNQHKMFYSDILSLIDECRNVIKDTDSLAYAIYEAMYERQCNSSLIIMFPIGRQDEEGNEIYEGDILKVPCGSYAFSHMVVRAVKNLGYRACRQSNQWGIDIAGVGWLIEGNVWDNHREYEDLYKIWVGSIYPKINRHSFSKE